MIDKQTIDRIMDAARIEEVIGDFVSLKKRGGNHIGCCPFHNEKTPSFYVSPSKGIYKCFGCGESGNVVGFLMKHEHYTYPEALKWLAAKYNIEVEEEPMSEEQRQQQTERDNLFHASEFAQKYFADLLFNDEMGRAIGLSYFHERGLTDEIIKRFGLGYCKEEWTDFTDHAQRNGYSLEVLEKTGLSIVKEDGKKYDRFRGRVMFPIFSISGRVIGFSGRILSKEKQAAKYVNSPESDIYDKSNALYGIYQARSAIGRTDMCYLVEGNVDVVSMHQSGVENCVASCGTSLTPQQIRIIRRYTNNVTVLYDGDAAGIKATIKAVNLLFAEGMHVRAVLFPDGEDPDSYAQKYGSEQLQNYLKEHSENFLMYRARLIGDEIKRDPMRKAEYVGEMAYTISLVADIQERAEYVKQCAYLFGTSEEILADMVRRQMIQARQKLYADQQKEAAASQSLSPSAPQPPVAAPPLSGPPPSVTAPPELDPFAPPDVVTPPSEYVAPHQTLPSLNPSEMQERQLARILVRNGANEVKGIDQNEQGQEVVVSTSVAKWIVNDLLVDEMTFDNPLYAKIFSIYAQCVADQAPLPDANFFAQHQDREVRNFALEQMLEPYSISPLWAEKRQIYVPKPEEQVEQEVKESLYAFKVKKIEALIDELRRSLNQPQSNEDTMMILAEIDQYQKIKHKIEEALHRVISV